MNRSLCRSVSVLLCVIAIGCSSKEFETHPVRGTVMFADGSPVQFGRVEFFSEDSQVSARGTIEPDGTFVMGTETDVDGAVVGTHQVLIMQMIAPSESRITPQKHGMHISNQFATFESSGLSFTVKPEGENIAKFVVEQ